MDENWRKTILLISTKLRGCYCSLLYFFYLKTAVHLANIRMSAGFTKCSLARYNFPGTTSCFSVLHNPIVFLVHTHSVSTAKCQGSLSMAMRQYFFLAIVLILLILTAGCTDTFEERPTLPTMSTLPVPEGNPQYTQILQSFGDVTGQGIPGGTIDIITLTVGLVNTSKSVDMEQLAIVYADAIRTETLYPVEGFHGDPPKGFWAIVRVDKEIGNPNNRLDNEEQFVIRINPKAPLVPRQMITIDIKPRDGRSLTIRRVAPPTIQAENILLPL
jgi:hypothetical protein